MFISSLCIIRLDVSHSSFNSFSFLFGLFWPQGVFLFYFSVTWICPTTRRTPIINTSTKRALGLDWAAHTNRERLQPLLQYSVI